MGPAAITMVPPQDRGPDSSLVAALRDESRPDIVDQLSELRTILVRVALGILREPAAAEDMAQAALLKLVAYVREVKTEIRNPTGLAVTIVRNLCIGALRQQSRAGRYLAPQRLTREDGSPVELAAEAIPQDELMAKEQQAQLLRQAVARLDPRHRQVLQGLYWEGKTQEEVAKGLGSTVRTVYNLRERALAKLMDWLR